MSTIKIFPNEEISGRKVIYTLCQATEEDVKNRPRKISSATNCGQKMVKQIQFNGTTIAIFNSIKEASDETNIDMSTISRVVNGKSFSAGGYCWREVDLLE